MKGLLGEWIDSGICDERGIAYALEAEKMPCGFSGNIMFVCLNGNQLVFYVRDLKRIAHKDFEPVYSLNVMDIENLETEAPGFLKMGRLKFVHNGEEFVLKCEKKKFFETIEAEKRRLPL